MKPTPPDITPDHIMLFGIAETATVLGIGRTNVYALIQSGKLRSVKIGGRRLIPRAALDDFVTELMSKS
jgi:excisionase family DNA binding protein